MRLYYENSWLSEYPSFDNLSPLHLRKHFLQIYFIFPNFSQLHLHGVEVELNLAPLIQLYLIFCNNIEIHTNINI